MSTGTCLNLYNNNPGIIDVPNATVSELACAGVFPDLEPMPLSDWIAVWSGPVASDPNDRFCTQIFHDNIYSLNGNVVFDPTVFARVQAEFTYMFNKYYTTIVDPPFAFGSQLVLEGSPAYSSMQTTLATACASLPGVCEPAQQSLCKFCSREEISNNSDLIAMCGCFAPTLPPAIYTRTIPVQCDPLCNNSFAAQPADPTSGAVNVCTDTVCVLDNITITATKSIIGNISITQICPDCAEKGCTCVVDTSILNMAASLGIDDPTLFQQFCPPSESTCIDINSQAQTSVVVPCQNVIPTNIPAFSSAIPTMVYVVLVILVVIVLICLTAYIYGANDTEVYVPILENGFVPSARSVDSSGNIIGASGAIIGTDSGFVEGIPKDLTVNANLANNIVQTTPITPPLKGDFYAISTAAPVGLPKEPINSYSLSSALSKDIVKAPSVGYNASGVPNFDIPISTMYTNNLNSTVY